MSVTKMRILNLSMFVTIMTMYEDELKQKWKNLVAADFAFLHAGRPFDLNMNCLLDIASFATNIIICDL